MMLEINCGIEQFSLKLSQYIPIWSAGQNCNFHDAKMACCSCLQSLVCIVQTHFINKLP